MREQVLTSPFSVSVGSGQYPGESTFITQNDIKRFITRYSATIAVSAMLGVLLSGAYVFTAVPLYTAYTQIIIDPSLPQALREPSSDGIFSIDNAQVESQLEVLRSEKIAGAVIDQLKLEDNPEFGGSSRSLFRLPWRMSRAETAATVFAKKRSTLDRFQWGLSVRRVGLSYALDILFSSQSADLAATIANATANAYVAEQINARAQATRQSGQWLEERIDQLRKQMNQAALEAQEFRARRDYRIAASHGGANDSGRAASGAAVEASESIRPNTMEELDSAAQTYRRIYESYLMAYTESVQKQSYPVTNARIITAATPPLRKSHPRTKLILVFGALMGCLAGLGIAFFRHRIDRSVSSARQVRDEIGVECLASIPRFASASTASEFASRIRNSRAAQLLKTALDRSPIGAARFSKVVQATNSRAGLLLQGRLAKKALSLQGAATDNTPTIDTDPLNAVVAMPFSSFSHGIKTLKTAISLASRTQPIRSLGITSALPNEGKTTLVSNLAALYAAAGVRVLIVDGDLRSARLSRALAPEAKFGLIDAIVGSAELEQCVTPGKSSGPDILAAAGRTTAHADDLLGSEKAQLLLKRLQKTYDLIVVELPPLVASVDSVAISSLLDCMVVVAEWGKTPIPVLAEAVHLLRNAQAKILGVILNKVDISTIPYGDVSARYYLASTSQPPMVSGRRA
jgi:capsular exopolysaccharide synthesis family protein